tara:strand:- start:87 stop:221 length:135 start_codon:yes stop_codon:yes gene_type:complete
MISGEVATKLVFILLPLFRKLPTPSTRYSKYLIGYAKINRVTYI